MKNFEPVYADNCGVCAGEYLSYELIPLKLGEQTFQSTKICLNCMVQSHDIYENYKKAAELLAKLSVRK